MAGRPRIQQADLVQLRKLYKSLSGVTDNRPLIAFVMKNCGCSYEEIGMVFDVSRQMATTLVSQAEREL